jgi:hypothetical protein
VAKIILVVLMASASLTACVTPFMKDEYCEFIKGWSDKYRNYTKRVYYGYCYATREQCESGLVEKMETMYVGCQTVPIDKPWRIRQFKFLDANGINCADVRGHCLNYITSSPPSPNFRVCPGWGDCGY